MLDVFLAWRGSGMGSGHLPFSGGYAEQPAGLMQALRQMAAAAAKLDKRH